MNAGGYAIFTFLFLILGLPYYLIQRGKHAVLNQTVNTKSCPSCDTIVDFNTSFCPKCGQKLDNL
jgi:hypothetical protein